MFVTKPLRPNASHINILDFIVDLEVEAVEFSDKRVLLEWVVGLFEFGIVTFALIIKF